MHSWYPLLYKGGGGVFEFSHKKGGVVKIGGLF